MWRVMACAVLLLTGCGDDDDDDVVGEDAGIDASGSAGDAGADAAVDAGPEGCRVVPPLVGGTPETDALATSPARCGMPPYTWRTGPDLGDVVSRADRADYSVAELETLLEIAGVPLPAPLEHDVAIETVAYVTQDRGSPVESSMLLSYPTDFQAGADAPVLLLLHGTSGFTHGCGATAGPAYRAITALYSSLGWITVAPDYLGLESAGEPYPGPHPYVIGEPTAIASLDAARAAGKALVADGPVCATTRLAVAGASQGGHAALWVDRLAPYYARELTLIGTVAWVPGSDLVAHADRALRSVVSATTLVAAGLVVGAPWYGVGDRLDEIFLAPWDTDLPAQLEQSCLPEVEFSSLEETFQPELLSAVAAGSITDFEPFGCMLGESSLAGTSIARIGPDDPGYGILFVMGQDDTLVVPEIERPSYDTLCAQGLPLQSLECAGAGHAEAVLWSFPEVVSFLDDRRNDVPFTPVCERPAATQCLGTP